MIQANINTKHFLVCPNCGEDISSVDHLPNRFQGRWSCSSCDKSFNFEFTRVDDCIVIMLEEAKEHAKKVLITLRSDAKPITLKVQGRVYSDRNGNFDSEEEQIEDKRYYYDEHTCPINYLDQVVKIIDGNGDDDPHGVFKFVSMEPWVEDDDE